MMMTGIVQETAIKEVTTKFGVKPTYSFKVNGTWIKAGFKNPGVETGFEVDFDAITGTYGLETKSVNILNRTKAAVPAPVAGSVPVPRTTSGGGYRDKVFPIPALHGDRSIVRQNALARATDLYIAARGGKPFELDASTMDLVIAFARKFEAYTAGDLDMAEAMKEEAAEAVAVEPTKE
jgi:hypothetical protein